MNPAKRNKIDLDKLTEEERKAFRMYGRLPTGKDVLSHKLKERKYFDSGDYALSKAGKTSGPVGVQHPSPETIPHIAATTHSSSPVKESSLVHEAGIGEKTDTQAVRAETGEKVDAQAVRKVEIGEKADTQATDANTQSTSTSTLNQTTPAPEPETPEQKQNSTPNPTTTSSSTETPPTSDS